MMMTTRILLKIKPMYIHFFQLRRVLFYLCLLISLVFKKGLNILKTN